MLTDLRVSNPTLIFQEEADGRIVCLIGNFKYGVLHADGSINEGAIRSLKRVQVFLDKETEMINMGKYGQYAIVLPDHSIMICPTEGGALNFAHSYEGEAFVSRIGSQGCDL